MPVGSSRLVAVKRLGIGIGSKVDALEIAALLGAATLAHSLRNRGNSNSRRGACSLPTSSLKLRSLAYIRDSSRARSLNWTFRDRLLYDNILLLSL